MALKRTLPAALARRDRVVRIVDPTGPPEVEATGTAGSVQAAELRLSPTAAGRLLSADGLERLAGAYWRFLQRVTLGLIRVRQTPSTREIVVLGRPLVLLTFGAPEYALDGDGGTVHWPIHGGLLVVRSARPAGGSFEIAVRRDGAGAGDGSASLRVEIKVADFPPSVAAIFGRRFYAATQGRIHVLITHAFLRSLGRFDPTRETSSSG